jgi:hypothetical protein
MCDKVASAQWGATQAPQISKQQEPAMKKTDLEKNKAMKTVSQMKHAGTPGRYGSGSAEPATRREQRRLDQEKGLVPFAVKLPGDLVAQVHALASERGQDLNDLVAELLAGALNLPPGR